MKNNFFRKDLNLKKRWWHRLFLVIFILSFISILGNEIISYKDGLGFQRWERTSTLNERIDTQLSSVEELLQKDEKISDSDSPYVLNIKDLPYDSFVLDNVYCSNRIDDQIEMLMMNKGIDQLLIREVYGRYENIPLDDFKRYLKNNKINCVTTDSYTSFDPSGSATRKLRFLEPDEKFQNEYAFYKPSTSQTILYLLGTSLLMLLAYGAIFGMIIVIYYKVLLYIVFGNQKSINEKKIE